MSDPLRDRLVALETAWRTANAEWLQKHDYAPTLELERAADLVADLIAAVPERRSKPWLTLCPDCDHGIRGGAPCETCQGEGSVSVVFASER